MTTPPRRPAWLRILATVASLRVTVIGLFLLLVLTVWGTLHQVENGLYQAQERFYYSWIFLVGGWIPLPGATLVMAVLFLNLFASVLYLIVIGRLRFSFLLTHCGLMLMLAAGCVTFYLGEESHLTLFEGEASNVSASYRDWELACWPTSGDPSRRRISAVDADRLAPGMTVDLIPGRLELTVDRYLRNCTPVGGTGGSDGWVGQGGIARLQAAPAPKSPSERLPGARIVLRAADGKEQRRIFYGGDAQPTVIEAGGDTYEIMLRRKRLLLPATIQLVDFKRELYTGSQIARSFSSRVVVRGEEDGSERQVLISMNKPLRDKGFTFYQSSYSNQGGRESSTLAVVKNYGRLLPYIATTVTVVGMSLHFLGMLILRAQRDAKRGARA